MDRPQVVLYYTLSGYWALMRETSSEPFRKGVVPPDHVHSFVVTMMETLTPIAWTTSRCKSDTWFKNQFGEIPA
jgi:hypothetical protein